MILYAFLWIAAAVFIGGLGFRVWAYASTPAPLRIPVTPAPLTRSGVVVRLFWEVALFRSLFNANKWTWLFGWAFHATLLFVLLTHLRYFVHPAWFWLSMMRDLGGYAGGYAGLAMVAALLALAGRRLLVPRVRAITAPSDFLALALLIAIGLSGLAMKFVFHTDIVAVKAFALGLIYLDPQPLPPDPFLIIHLSLVAILLVVFPFSKLLHGAALFFNPTRNQPDDLRESRYAPRVTRRGASTASSKTA
jgi:nitrate reductase gamma subunit